MDAMKHGRRALCVVCAVGVTAAMGRPLPVSTSTITVSYQTSSGVVSFSGERDYTGRFPGDSTRLEDAPNLAAFNSAGSELGVFGRRAASILLNNPTLPDVFNADESLVTHALFKIDNDQLFFPGFVGGRSSEITLTVENIQFDEPVLVLEDTLMLHVSWKSEQVNLLDDFYIQLNNHHTITDSFRDFDTFMTRLFFDFPEPNYVLNDADLAWTITGERTDTLSVSVTFPYEILENLEEDGQIFLPGLPAPEGFLEPIHFHLEYAVAPSDHYPFRAATTKIDFFRGGSQPAESYEQILSSQNCGLCHGGNDPRIPVNKPWAGSMHGLSARDPLWAACMTATEQDAEFVGDMCIRCHAPRAWISGRSTPTDGSAINESDRDSISCHFCHRMVDPVYKPDVSPPEDERILANIVELPVAIGSGSFVLDPADGRRGKRGTPLLEHTNILSPYFEDSVLCEVCHDVGNPTLTRQPDDTYVGNPLGEPHPTGEKYDMFPLERTSSEWLMSDFARKGVDMGGRFGGNKRIVSTCQDCHMPDTTSRAADAGPVRDDMADHGMYGSATWIPLVVARMYPDDVDIDAINTAVEGARSMLRRAATMEVTQLGDTVNVRVINETGHKLPTGQAEGRQMWLAMRFFDIDDQLIAERGYYDPVTATPADDAFHYELVLGMDAAVAAAVGLTPGPTHHIAFCNVIYKDNRIPPRGFTNEAYRQIQSPVIGAVYRDGQYWDDQLYTLPQAAVRVEAGLYFKTASTEFVTYLRDVNHTDDTGDILYEQWEQTGKSPPEEMVAQTLDLTSFNIGDFSGDLLTDLDDIFGFTDCLEGPEVGPVQPHCEQGDLDADNDVDLADVARMMLRLE